MSQNRRESDRPSGYSYLDGVTVKISEKFRPSRKVTLPLNYHQRCPADLLNDEYDFSLEKQVLELANTKRRGKEATERAKTEKLASTIEDFTRFINGTKAREDDFWTTRIAPPAQQSEVVATDIADVAAGSADRSGIPAPKPAILEPNVILKPIPLESSVSVKPDVTMIASESLNLADFESESSPFDSMALKTLNDIEELKSVLQNSNVPVTGPDGQSRLCKSGPDRGAESEAPSIHPNSADSDCGQAVASLNHGKDTASIDKSSCSNDAVTAMPYCTMSANITWNAPGSTESCTLDTRGLDPLNSVSPSDSSSQGAPLEPSSKCGQPEELHVGFVPLVNSRSTPDLLKELGIALATERERKRMAVLTTTEQTEQLGNTSHDTEGSPDDQQVRACIDTSAVENAVVNERLHVIENRDVPSIDVPEPSGCGADNVILINHIADMGFPKSRVIRAIQKLGADDKKLVEHLCMVQSFIEAGHSAQDAETALFLNDHNEIEAKKYLELMLQFKDLGFEEDHIRNALLQSKNDRDKALDILVSE